MEKGLLFFFFLTISNFTIAQDTIIFNNGTKINGKVLMIDSLIVYLKDNYSEDGIIRFDKNDVQEIMYGTSLSDTNKIPAESQQIINIKPNNNFDNCLKGKMDAEIYYDRAFGNIISGFLFGTFGVIGAAVSKPQPLNSPKTIIMSKNKDLFNDPNYLKCYKKKKRSMNVLNSLYGWAGWSILLIFLTLKD